MEFNFKKYEKRKFHSDNEINKKIIALFLLLDYEIYNGDVSDVNQLKLIDDWIIKFIHQEYYEVIPSFKQRRSMILKRIKVNELENMSLIELIKSRINKIFNKKNKDE